jgi:CubicO group peptidase (beta-lactamase class C family)
MTDRTRATRRRFLSLGASIAATGAISRSASGRKILKETWIPPKEFMAELPLLMEVASLPGLSIAVAEEGEVVWNRSVGVANAKTREPLRQDTIYEAASLGKPVFAYVVMRLADEKLIDLDRPLVQYHKPDYLPDHPYIDQITARDALRHSTGLPNWRIRPEDKLIPAFKPGSRWLYSGEGYFWLQLVVESITGKGVDTVMRSRLFEPAQMPLSTYGWNSKRARLGAYGHNGPGDKEGEAAFQYNREIGDRLLAIANKWGKPISAWTYEDTLRAIPEAITLKTARPLPENMAKAPIEYFQLPVNLFPNVAGSLGSTVTEYAKFMTLMLKRSKRASWEITETRRRAMLSHQIARKAHAIYWGLGWGLEKPSSDPLFYHGGNNGGIFKSFALGDPVRRRVIVIFTNGGGGSAICQRIVRAATGYDLLDFIF